MLSLCLALASGFHLLFSSLSSLVGAVCILSFCLAPQWMPSFFFFSPPLAVTAFTFYFCLLQSVGNLRAQVSLRWGLVHSSRSLVFKSEAPVLMAAAQGTPFDHLALEAREACDPGSCGTETIMETVLGRLSAQSAAQIPDGNAPQSLCERSLFACPGTLV